MDAFSKFSFTNSDVCPGKDGKPCGMLLTQFDTYCFGCGLDKASWKATSVEEPPSLVGTPSAKPNAKQPATCETAKVSDSPSKSVASSKQSSASPKKPDAKPKAIAKKVRLPKGTGPRSGTVYMVPRPDLSKNPNAGEGYKPPKRIGGSKGKKEFTQHHADLMKKLEAQYDFSNTDDPETVAAHFKWMLAKGGEDLGVDKNTGRLRNDGNVFKYPNYLIIFMTEGSGIFDDESDFNSRNEGLAKRVARDYVAKKVVTQSKDKVKYPDLSPEHQESLRNKLFNNVMHGFNDMVECLNKENAAQEDDDSGNSGSEDAGGDQDDQDDVASDETPSRKRAADDNDDEPVSAKRSAVGPADSPSFSVVINPQNNPDEPKEDEVIEYEEEEEAVFAPTTVFDGGIGGLGVSSQFAFGEDDVLFIESAKVYPLVGKKLNIRLLKHGHRNSAGWGFLDDEVMSSCMRQLQTLRKNTYVVPLGVTHSIITRSCKGGDELKRPKERIKESDQAIFVINIGGNLKKPANERKGNHWVVLECKKDVPGLVLGFDSLSSVYHDTEMKEAAEFIKKFVWPSNPELVYLPHPIHCRSDLTEDRVQQPDGEWDCGIFALSFVKKAINLQIGNNWEDQATEMEQELSNPLDTRRKIAAYIRDFSE